MKKILVFFMLAVTLITYVQGVTISSSYISDITLDGVPAVIENTHGEERLFFAIDPDKGAAFTAILSCPGATQILFDGQNIPTDNPVITVADYATGNHTLSVIREGVQRTWRLVFTTLPIVCFDSDLEAMLAVRNSEDLYYQNPRKKTDGHIVIVDPLKRTNGEYVFSQNTKSRIRGATSGGYSKKSFTVSLYDDAYEDKVDATVLGMRDDDGWILDAMYADHARMRNRLLFDIWNDMDDLPYDKDSDKPFQANGTHGMHVEMLFNGSYFGLYCLTDKIDRKQLNLKKSRTDLDGNYAGSRGILWKGRFMQDICTFNSYPKEYPADTLYWGYVSQEYPDDNNSQANWEPLKQFIDLISPANNGKYDEGAKGRLTAALPQWIYIDNVVNYQIFGEVFCLQDNWGKNLLYSIRNLEKGHNILFTPWDLDASLGRTAGGGIHGTDDPKWHPFGEQCSPKNGMYFTLLQHNPLEYKTRLRHRWNTLKDNLLSPDAVYTRMKTYADKLTNSGAWAREKARWPEHAGDVYEEIDYMKSYFEIYHDLFEKAVANFPTGITSPAMDESDDILLVYTGTGSINASVSDPNNKGVISVFNGAGHLITFSETSQLQIDGLVPGIYCVQLRLANRILVQKVVVRE